MALSAHSRSAAKSAPLSREDKLPVQRSMGAFYAQLPSRILNATGALRQRAFPG